MKKRSLYLLIYSLVIFTFSACKSDYSPEEKHSATISLSLSSSARTVLPEYKLSEMTDFVLKGKKANESEKILATFSDASVVNSSKLQIDVGDWIFTLTAKIGDSVFYSVISKTVVPGDNVLSFSLKLSEIGEDAGSINVSLTFPENAEITCIKAGLFDVETDSEITGFKCENLIFANSKVTYSKSDVPAGSYWLKFIFYGKDDLYLNTYKELVTVSSDLESSAERKIESLNEVYSIKFVTNGGEFVGTVSGSYTRFSEVEIPENITKKAYSFNGWYDNQEFSGEKVAALSKGSTGNKIFYAKWSPISYSITYNLDGGENSSSNKSSYTVEDEFNFESASKNGYTFAGWYTDSEYSNRKNGVSVGTTEEITLFAKWTMDGYVITYNLNGGVNSSENPVSYCVEDNITFAEPTRRGYNFDGWYTDSNFLTRVTNIPQGTTGNITLYAKWIIIDYTITYNLDGGENSSSNKSSYTVEDIVTFENPKKKGYVFAGWYEDSEFIAQKGRLEAGSIGNVILYAKWSRDTYSISYSLDGGKNASENPENYNVEDIITFAEPTRRGYNFDGWYTDSNFLTKVTNIPQGTTGNITLYAKWIIIDYTITYNLDGGENSSANKSSYTVEESLVFEPASKIGCSFDGWYTDSSFFTRKNEIEIGSTENVVLYAKWRYSITYNLNGGTNSILNPVSYSTGEQKFFSSPSRPGYTFLGWYTTPDFSGEKTSSIAIGTTGNIELYAKWSANTDTKYSVKHWWQNISDDGYTLHETDDKTGTTDTETNAIEKSYVGFTSKSFVQKNISGYGTTEVNIYYDRNIISLSINLDGGYSFTPIVKGKISGRYGAPVEFSTPYRTDYYKFIGWNTVGGTLPAIFTEEASYTALWSTLVVSASLSQLSDISMSYSQSGSVITFTADSGYSSYSWELDGSLLPSSSKSISIDTVGFRKGTYEIYLLAEKNGDYRSATAFIKVE